MISIECFMNFSGLDLQFYEGWCRFGSDYREWMKGLSTTSDVKCNEICQTTNGCSAFSFEYNNVEEPCNIYTNGPYTYGSGRANTKCYILPKGDYLIFFVKMRIFILIPSHFTYFL